jgi:hypothetical protein
MDSGMHLGPGFREPASTGKMRDQYPIALFRMGQVITSFHEGLDAEAGYLLPWALTMRYLLSELMFEFDLRIFIDFSSDCLEKMCEFGE